MTPAIRSTTLFSSWHHVVISTGRAIWSSCAVRSAGCAGLCVISRPHAEGGYRKYYEGDKRGTTLQGGGTCGGLGIDYEFYESSLLPSIIPCGFLGLRARSDGSLAIHPRLPNACPEMTLNNILFHNTHLDIRAANNAIEINCRDLQGEPICAGNQIYCGGSILA